MPPVARLAGFVLLLIPWTRAFYLPGSAPRDYSLGEKVDVFVNALTPVIGPQAKLVRVMQCLNMNPDSQFGGLLEIHD